MPTNNNVRPATSLEVDVPRQTSWHVPKGQHPSHIRTVSLVNRLGSSASNKNVRIVFSVQVPNTNLDYLAKIETKLDLNEGSELWNLICRLVGRRALQESSEGKLNLEQLVGLACEIEIDHNCDKAEEHGFPLVIVTDVKEAGKPVKLEEKE